MRIRRKVEPPNGKIVATFSANNPLLEVFTAEAKMNHNINSPRKPERKECQGFWKIIAATTNAAIASDHQGRYKPKIKLRIEVRKIEVINFIAIANFDYDSR